jgi:hypothetical protein
MAKPIVNQKEEIETMRKATRVSKCGRLLVEAGLSLDDFQVIIDDPIKRANLVRYWRADCYAPVGRCSYDEAEQIMGRNFLGVGSIMAHFGKISPPLGPKEIGGSVPWPEIMLQECKDTHVLMLGIGVTIEEISICIYTRTVEWRNTIQT